MASESMSARLPEDRTGLRVLLFSIFALSGVAGLIYEAVWGRYLRLFLGHSAYAQTFVIAVFMGGMAAGAWIASRYSTRWKSLLRGYALIEIAIGVFAFSFQTLFEAATAWAYGSVIPALESPMTVNLFKQLFSVSLIIVPSVLLGMTFPLMSGGVVRLFPKSSGSVLSMLYFTNSIGAAFGVMLTGFVLVKWIGLPGSMMLAGLINVFIGLVMLALSKVADEPELEEMGGVNLSTSNDTGQPRLLLFVAAFTGLASFIYEIAWIRMLSMLLGSSSHAFEIMLATFIAGLAFGGLWVKRRIDTLEQPVVFLGRMQWIMGILALATVFFYNECFVFMRNLMVALTRTEDGYLLFNVGSNLLAMAVMFPAAFCAGTTLPLITYSLLQQGYGEKSIGLVYSANTVGAIIGVFFSTHIGLPYLGLKWLIFVGASVDVGLGIVLLRKGFFARRALLTMALGAGTLIVGFGAFVVDFDRLRMASGVYRSGTLFEANTHESVYHRDGKTASIDVIKEKQSDAVIIMTNGKPDASLYLDGDRRPARDATTQTLSGVLPLAVHPKAKTVAVIGFGSGMTSAMLLGSTTIERLDTIEIERSMVEGAEHFRPRNELVYTDPRSRIIYEDARTYFSAQKARYDIIVSEPSNPWVSGVATLFSEEFYERIVKHINDDGVLVQWLQLYELGPELLSSVLVALSKTFKHYTLFATDDHNILIVARVNSPIGPLDASVFENPVIKHELWRHRILNLNVLEAYRVANREALEPLMMSYESPPNSDYFPFLDARAARSRFLRRSSVDIAAASGSPVPVFEILGGVRTYAKDWLAAPFPPLSSKQSIRLTRAKHTAEAVAMGRQLLGHNDPTPMSADKVRAIIRLRAHMIECKPMAKRDELWRELVVAAAAMTPYLDSASLETVWDLMKNSPCADRMSSLFETWLTFWGAAGRRDGLALRNSAVSLLNNPEIKSRRNASIALIGALVSDLVGEQPQNALKLWEKYKKTVLRGADVPMVMRVLLAHAQYAHQKNALK